MHHWTDLSESFLKMYSFAMLDHGAAASMLSAESFPRVIIIIRPGPPIAGASPVVVRASSRPAHAGTWHGLLKSSSVASPPVVVEG